MSGLTFELFWTITIPLNLMLIFRKSSIFRFFVGGMLVALPTLVQADKIQFSTSEKPPQAPVERKSTESSTSFGNSSSGPSVPSFYPTPLPSVTNPNRADDEAERKKNWMFARPEDTPSVEEVFKIKNKSFLIEEQAKSPSKGFLGAAMDQGKEQTAGKLKSNRETETFETERKSKADLILGGQQPATAEAAFKQLNEENSAANRGVLGPNPGQTSFSDVFGVKNNSELLKQQTEFRRSELNQMLQPRTTAVEPITSLADRTLQPVNTILPTSDSLSRYTQSSMSDQVKSFSQSSSVRGSVLDDFNTRANTDSAFQSQKSVSESIMARPQPAVLPFPSRPGEIFKRPGSY